MSKQAMAIYGNKNMCIKLQAGLNGYPVRKYLKWYNLYFKYRDKKKCLYRGINWKAGYPNLMRFLILSQIVIDFHSFPFKSLLISIPPTNIH